VVEAFQLRKQQPTSRQVCLFEKKNSQQSQVRFSPTTDGATSNPVDSILSLVTSDVGSIAVGGLGILALFVGRLLDDSTMTADSSGEETRSNLLALFAAGSILLNGLSKLQVDTALAQTVNLDGVECSELANTPADWVMESILVATPAKTVILVSAEQDWKVRGRIGIVPSDSTVPSKSPILDRFRTPTDRESYLPTLQALPGKTEFTYLPSNTQAVLLIPITRSANKDPLVLVLGSNRARSFTPRDIAWCQVVAARLEQDLQ
jgi:hypothetical protein